jgi:dCMP deaminase
MIEYRKNRLSWHDYFMVQAVVISLRSPDPNTQVGSALIKKNKLISAGYNGAPKGIHPNKMSWEREGKYEDTKYAMVVHSELSCILNARQDLNDTTMYCTLHPCETCMKAIINAGITTVYYLDDKYNETISCKIAQKMAELVDLKIEKYVWESERARDIANFIQKS